jgi:RNA polymerase sigma-70 factor (ECF subfamily)
MLPSGAALRIGLRRRRRREATGQGGGPVTEAAVERLADEDFLKELRGGMLRFAQLQLRDEQLAEDLVQDALVSAMAGAKGFAGRAALGTWVLSILRNKISDALRLRARSINISSMAAEGESLDEAFESLFRQNAHWKPESRPGDWVDPEEALRRRQFWDVFEACLEHLPENTARVFMMREFLEFDTGEICRELGINQGNCHVILHRARNGLRRCLEQGWFAEARR